MDDSLLTAAAAALKSADALLIGAGAGMGVDSGLPDFRGPEGFWEAYPPYRKLGLNFVDLANPEWFDQDPALAWGFYGHRRNLYRQTAPHAGFQILRKWAERMRIGYFIFTSNVDGHFQKAGFPVERVMECRWGRWRRCVRWTRR
jgi:NAD-dependent SIR2 family protein deacetylase